jgi:protein-S-isoprenylcysteine O-methyltransferase Ste14
MNKNIEKIDEIIKDALTAEEAKFYDELDEQNLLQMLGGAFKGKLGWLIVIMNIVIVIVFGLFIYCAIQFFNTAETNELIRWSVAGTFCMIVISILKLFIWMQMDKNSILRELKRMEFQVSLLAGKSSD